MQFQFASLAEFFSMSGHGPYVWAAYAVTLIVLLALAAAPLRQLRQLQKEQHRQQRIAEARKRRQLDTAPQT